MEGVVTKLQKDWCGGVERRFGDGGEEEGCEWGNGREEGVLGMGVIGGRE
jgi:hypothetical protein